jgi:hypothetical protein
MLSVVMLKVIMLIVVMLNVVLLSVIMLNVVAPLLQFRSLAHNALQHCKKYLPTANTLAYYGNVDARTFRRV